ncbi:protease, heat-shock-like protein [Agrobacterium tumefaciens str. Cherry 2E-2-2]|nr:protease, heat-shock-like protein [Agrobacterium tumefaciens str. Cherry 2E-2-2]
MTEMRINMGKIRNSSFPTWLGLVFGSWFGLAWGSLISMPVGVGFGVAAGTVVGGFLAVPLWGTIWGLVGLGGQRKGALRQLGVKPLGDDDPLTLRVGHLAGRLGLKTRPWVAVMPHTNAFAIGANANSALVVIGRPLMEALTDAELDAVIGHELGHIASNDMRRMGLARSFQNALAWYLGFSNTLQRWARWTLTWMSELSILSMSRKREYWADAVGAALTSKEHMISALEKLHQIPSFSDFERQHARLMVRGRTSALFSTHPTLEERRRALQKETYLRRVARPAQVVAELTAPVALPVAEEIAYAKS